MFGYQTSRKDAKFVDQHDATIICFCQGSIELPGVNKVILHKSRVEHFFSFLNRRYSILSSQTAPTVFNSEALPITYQYVVFT